MILLSDVIERIRRIGLDAEGSDFYLNEVDIIPAVNASVEWIVSIISTQLGRNKFVEEKMSFLHHHKVWQTSMFSRVSINPQDIEHDIWTITGVFPKPQTYIEPFPTSSVGGTSAGTVPGVIVDYRTNGFHPLYIMQVQSYFGQLLTNRPIVSVNWSTGVKLKNEESIFRPEMAFISGDHAAKRLTVEQQTESNKNPFAAGYPHEEDLVTYGYFPYTDYTSPSWHNGYTLDVPHELEIKPASRRMIVSIAYLKAPDKLSNLADPTVTNVELPIQMANVLAEKALNYISYKQGDNTNIYSVSERDVLQLVTNG